jgi:hypothetical protein
MEEYLPIGQATTASIQIQLPVGLLINNNGVYSSLPIEIKCVFKFQALCICLCFGRDRS